jgi:choline monooxygenase
MELSPHACSILEGLKQVAGSTLEEAFTVPPAIYSDTEIHALELERIFKQEWVSPGMAADIPKPGDYLTYTVAGQPVFIIRSKDGSVRSYANVCLHRMMTLLEGKGCAHRITCPYHGWTYDTEGKVIGAGYMANRDPEFDKKGYRLPEIRTEIWHGIIYVTLNPQAVTVKEQLKDLEPEVARFRLEHYIPIDMQDHVWTTNWKLLTENFMESYHLPVAHKETVGAWCPVDQSTFPDQTNPAFTWQTFEKDETARYGRAHKDNHHLEGKWRYTSLMPSVFPTHMYVLAPDHMWYLSLMPKGPEQVHVRFGAQVAPEVKAALGDKYEEWRSATIAFFNKVNAEDKFVVEGIHRGSASPLARSGPFSWLEREIHDFTKYLDAKLNGPGRAGLRVAAE